MNTDTGVMTKELINNIADAAHDWWEDSWSALVDSANNWYAVCKAVDEYNGFIGVKQRRESGMKNEQSLLRRIKNHKYFIPMCCIGQVAVVFMLMLGFVLYLK